MRQKQAVSSDPPDYIDSQALLALIPNRNLKASNACEFRLCRGVPDESGATEVATELVRHAAGMTRAQVGRVSNIMF